ncbi:major Facilitator Superfamily protein [Ralstonia insidiosa]|uniref:Major Facilitator Superfamily protein n=1 Tax=Ralstonia insidiosa TaxID=190721 RepID=A0AAC9BLT0_9RALS|nr:MULTISPECIES: MFS transporter [Ralstonia]ANH76362.1 major Facilitator Superfamily protein [Ralstonia insidiosa]EPX99837.1 MFS transporter [Ralstonia sp. AU12-08]MBY4705444.1 MFS transporter [Ralstonia insidiosa]GAQ29572.1 major facilitator superfamily (MFS_1) transporter [Ralstonia sp. NT80]
MQTQSTQAGSVALSTDARASRNARTQRYVQLMLLVIAAGAIYPMLYLRQVYQSTMLAFFHIDDVQLGYLYSSLGTIFLLSYLPSGWLADRLPPRWLICFSLLATGALGLLYVTGPSFAVLVVIFGAWGLSTGLTFWAAVIKRVNMIAGPDEQGRFFGLLDGGRGLIEALLATIAIALFAYVTQTRGDSDIEGFKRVVHLYAFCCIALGVLLALVKDGQPAAQRGAKAASAKRGSVLADLKTLAAIPELWLVVAIVFCGYQVFWATYSFSAYLHEGGFGLSATAAGAIATLKLWMRPIGGIGGGWLGDRTSKASVLFWALVLAAVSLVGLIFAPTHSPAAMLVVLVLFIGILTYAVRGLYWSLLDDCKVPPHCAGLAIGLISVLGYAPDVFLPLINGYITQTFAGARGYQLFFGYIAAVALLGAGAAAILKQRLNRKKETP